MLAKFTETLDSHALTPPVETTHFGEAPLFISQASYASVGIKLHTLGLQILSIGSKAQYFPATSTSSQTVSARPRQGVTKFYSHSVPVHWQGLVQAA